MFAYFQCLPERGTLFKYGTTPTITAPSGAGSALAAIGRNWRRGTAEAGRSRGCAGRTARGRCRL